MRKVLKYLIPVLVCVAGVFAVLGIKGSFVKSGQPLIGDLCDAFFVPGVLMLCFGLLVFATNDGAFDMLAFGIIKLFDLFRRDLTKVKYRTFYDYRKAQEGRKRPYIYLMIIGGAFVLAAVAFLLAYHFAF